LARLQLLVCLPALASAVWLPQSVFAEVSVSQHPEGALIQEAVQQGWLAVVAPTTAPVLPFALDAGETAVLQLALQHQATVLIDERRARTAAKQLGIPLLGTLGLLLLLKEQQHITAIAPCLRRLQTTGYHLSSPLVQQVLAAAGEALSS
jgi:predicted nucleic acid-binding protein